MPHVGSLRNIRFHENDADDIRGAKIYGRNDDKLGEIADVIFDHQTGNIQYAVVYTGGWFTHKQFLVPADRIEARGNDRDSDEYRVNLSKEDVERFPKYDPDSIHDDERWQQYDKDYRQSSSEYFAGGDVLHRADSANIITPPGIPASGGGGDVGDVDARIRGQASNVIAGAMNTSSNAWGQQQDTRRLTPSLRTDAFQPDVHTTDTEAAREQSDERPADSSILGLSGSNLNRGSAMPDRRDNRDPERVSTVSDPDFHLNRVSDEPFRASDIGAQSSESDRMEEAYDRDDADMYQASRTGQPLRGEFVNAGTSRSTTEVPTNAPNTTDSEFRTAEGDSIYNASDAQYRENLPEAAYASDSGVTPELSGLRQQQETQGLGARKGPQSEELGSRVGRRWDRFQDRLRNEKDRITGECADCERERNRAA
ncbi:MAG: hypothetical protein NVS9B15_25850 [Acidobacteriaceae bacterium]